MRKCQSTWRQELGYDPVEKESGGIYDEGSVTPSTAKDRKASKGGMVGKKPEEELKYLDYKNLTEKAKSSKAMAKLSVNLYYTKEYEKASKDMRGRLSEVFYVTNKGFSNSDVRITVSILCIQEYSGNEKAHEAQDLLKEFKKSKSSFK